MYYMKNEVSPREHQVLELIAEGLTDQEIADKLHISLSTANSHRKKLLSKLNAKNAAVLVRNAMRSKMLK
jgi:DNA-binding NarL/FixJ family response regulator